jgi:hypothetical protein
MTAVNVRDSITRRDPGLVLKQEERDERDC